VNDIAKKKNKKKNFKTLYIYELKLETIIGNHCPEIEQWVSNGKTIVSTSPLHVHMLSLLMCPLSSDLKFNRAPLSCCFSLPSITTAVAENQLKFLFS
jgi:hypothetical protein